MFQESANAQRGGRGVYCGNGEFGGNAQFDQSSNRPVQYRPIPNGFVEGPYGGFIEVPNGATFERPNGAINDRPMNFPQNGRIVAPNNFAGPVSNTEFFQPVPGRMYFPN